MGSPKVIIPLLTSILLYFCILCGILYYVGAYDTLVKRYTSHKDDFLEVALIKRTEQKNVKNPTVAKKAPEQLEAKKTPPPPKQEKKQEVKQKTAIKESPKVKDLFGKIKVKAKPKPIPVAKKSPAKKSRLKSSKKTQKKQNKASKLVSSLSLDSTPVAGSASSRGEYDEFRGKVQEMLDGYWEQTRDTVGNNEARVRITIGNGGRFSYNIVSLSYNDAFNTKLREFLEAMKDVKFPNNTKNVPSMTITFKDKME